MRVTREEEAVAGVVEIEVEPVVQAAVSFRGLKTSRRRRNRIRWRTERTYC
jgi:hypothetical protein